MRVGAIVQARTSSVRMPGKILRALPFNSGISALAQVVRRLKKCKKLDTIVVATTTNAVDDQILKISVQEHSNCFRGSEQDVLSRYCQAAKENALDIIVRITSDCPCLDPKIVDAAIEKHIKDKADFTSNILTRTYPHGLDAEVLNFETLDRTDSQAKEAFEREHVTPYIYNSHPEMFRIASITAPKALYAPEIRITLDTENDYALLCAVFDFLYPANEFFDAEEIINLFRNKPWLKAFNKDVVQKKVFDNLQQELKEAIKLLDLQELKRASDLLSKHLH
jgi:spore coat polysaccharide biosynthesis protein SpsF